MLKFAKAAPYIPDPERSRPLITEADKALGAHNPPTNLQTVPAVIETDWYPRQLFLLFKAPAAGVRIGLDHKDKLARVVVVHRQEALTAESLSAAGLEALEQRRAVNIEEEKTTPSTWTAATGEPFSYKPGHNLPAIQSRFLQLPYS